ncbi:MAG: hypothetical protein GY875_08430 [Gammaproteobacteria bacterium]|nr:hypothetical protein [Gammaproteobacteria bacterium]
MEQKMLALDPCDVINLDAYPITDTSSSAFAALVERLRNRLDAQQYVVLPNFIRPAAREQAVAQIQDLLHLAHHNTTFRNCYLEYQTAPSLPDDHPKNILKAGSNWILAADLLPTYSPLKTIYYWENTMQLVSGIVGDKVCAFEDPLGSVNALCLKRGDHSSWHFDSDNAFTMTLMLQAPERGGKFEMIPNLRTDEDPRYEQVSSALLGNQDDVVAVGREEGALCIFRGCNSLHRVTPVEGDSLRIMGTFFYENKPGVVGDPIVNETVHGRRATVPN